jgi:hypothetical protein
MTLLMDWLPALGGALGLTLTGLVLWRQLRHRAMKQDAPDQTEIFGQPEMKRRSR